MSYILDALKKSEAERSRSSGTTLLTSSAPTRSHSSLVIWALLAVLLVNACVMGAWLLSRSPSPMAEAPITARSGDSPTTPRAPDATTLSRLEAHRSRGAPRVQGASETTRPEPLTAEMTDDDVAPPTDDSVPQLDFTTHVYADDPTQRAVTLDGRRFTEGDVLRPGMTLVEITETGVVLDVDGRTVAMDLVQGWR